MHKIVITEKWMGVTGCVVGYATKRMVVGESE